MNRYGTQLIGKESKESRDVRIEIGRLVRRWLLDVRVVYYKAVGVQFVGHVRFRKVERVPEGKVIGDESVDVLLLVEFDVREQQRYAGRDQQSLMNAHIGICVAMKVDALVLGHARPRHDQVGLEPVVKLLKGGYLGQLFQNESA